MKTLDEENWEFDDFIRQKLSGLNPQYEESAWEALEVKLDQTTHKAAIIRPLIYRRIALVAASVIILAMVYAGVTQLGFNQEDKTPSLTFGEQQTQNDKLLSDKKNIKEEEIRKENIVVSDQESEKADVTNSKDKKEIQNQSNPQIENNFKSPLNETIVTKNQDKIVQSFKNNNNPESGKEQLFKKENVVVENTNKINEEENHSESRLARTNSVDLIDPVQRDDYFTKFASLKMGEEIKPLAIPPKTDKLIINKLPKLMLGFMMSPELDFISIADKHRLSLNTGLVAEWRIEEKLSLFFGVSYMQKQYKVKDFVEVPPTQGLNISANSGALGRETVVLYEATEVKSNIIDLPVELKYYFNSGNKTSYFAGVGISNYIFTKQTFDYDIAYTEKLYADYYSKPLTATPSLEDRQTTAYIASTANLSVGMSQKIGGHARLNISPYYKLALRGSGLENVAMNSFGLRTVVYYAVS